MKEKLKKILLIYLYILPIIDLITSLSTRFSIPFSIGAITKGIFILFSVVYIFFLSKSKYKKYSILYLILLFLFSTIYIFTKPELFNLKVLMSELSFMLKYYYLQILFLSFINLFDSLDISKEEISKVLYINAITYCILMILPYITNTGFNSYNYSGMGGTCGWFYSANEVGVILIILFNCIYLHGSPNLFKYILLLLMAFSIFTIGTKAGMLGIIISCILYCIYTIINFKNKKSFISCVVMVIFVIFMSFFSAGYQNISERKTSIKFEEATNIFENKESTDDNNKNVTKSTFDTLRILILSRRDEFFIQNYKIFDKSSIVDKLFGLSWSDREDIGYLIQKKVIESDPLDIFIHYGVIGFIILFLPIVYFYIISLKKVLNHRDRNIQSIFYLVLLTMIFGMSLLMGHILSAPAVSIYCAIIMTLIFMNKKEMEI